MPRSKGTPVVQTPSGPITSFEIVERPVTTRGQYQMDAETKALMDTVGTGKAVRLHIDERVDLHKIHMALRHAMQRADLSLHYKKVGDRTLLAWAEKVTKALVMALFITGLTACGTFYPNPESAWAKCEQIDGGMSKSAQVGGGVATALVGPAGAFVSVAMDPGHGQRVQDCKRQLMEQGK